MLELIWNTEYEITFNNSIQPISGSTPVITGDTTFVSGYRGQLYGVLPVTTSSSYVKTTGTSGSQNISVSATGLVTAGSATGSGVNVWITATYYDPTSGSLSDTVSVVTTA